MRQATAIWLLPLHIQNEDEKREMRIEEYRRKMVAAVLPVQKRYWERRIKFEHAERRRIAVEQMEIPKL